MKFIGVDLAWTYKNETGICILEEKKCIFCDAKVYSDEMIIELMEKYVPCIVSVDAPLVVKNESGGRSIDSVVMKTKINGRFLKLYATSRSYMFRTFKAVRGETLLEKSDLVLGENIFETYPTGIFLSLFPEIYDQRYKISSKLPLLKLIENSNKVLEHIRSLGFEVDLDNEVATKKKYKVFEDKLDSVLCAINSYYLYHGSSLCFKDDSGFITLPKKL